MENLTRVFSREVTRVQAVTRSHNAQRSPTTSRACPILTPRITPKAPPGFSVIRNSLMEATLIGTTLMGATSGEKIFILQKSGESHFVPSRSVPVQIVDKVSIPTPQLEALGTPYTPPTYKEIQSIKTLVGPLLEVCQVLNVRSPKLASRYCYRKEQLTADNTGTPIQELDAFHGTPEESVAEIIENGFDERLSQNGYFGAGIYFTQHASKANHFCGRFLSQVCHLHKCYECPSCYGYLLLCRVNLGRSYYKVEETDKPTGWGHPPPGYNRYASFMRQV